MDGEKDMDRDLETLSEEVERGAPKKRKPIKTMEDLHEASASLMAGFDEVIELERIRRVRMLNEAANLLNGNGELMNEDEAQQMLNPSEEGE